MKRSSTDDIRHHLTRGGFASCVFTSFDRTGIETNTVIVISAHAARIRVSTRDASRGETSNGFDTIDAALEHLRERFGLGARDFSACDGPK